jgi:RNAse (barnase) inhibitor barstar
VGAGKLGSTPEIYQISNGNSMTSVFEEYNDAQQYYQSYNQILQLSKTYGTVLNEYQYAQWKALDSQWKAIVNKYGIKVGSSS